MKLSKQIKLILTEGKHAGSHKFALLRSILDYIVEKNPEPDKHLNIPLIYISEKILTYLWVMYLNRAKQIPTSGRFLYYEYLDEIVSELGIKEKTTNTLNENHIHNLWELLGAQTKLSPKLITALNKTRRITFNGPVKHSLYVNAGGKQTNLDLYSFSAGTPGMIKAETYREFYENEHISITVKKEHIKNLKEMHYWYEQAIITAWARYTDQFPENREKTNYTGLTLLVIPEPSKGNLNIYKKHYLNRLGVVTCVYCNKKHFEAIDHIIPWKMVKNDQFWNMLPICRSCNSSKSDRIWELKGTAKKILKKSINDIVTRLDEIPDFKNQVVTHFYHIHETQPKDIKDLGEYLYKLTLGRIDDFVSDN